MTQNTNEKPQETLVAYKGFNPDWTCRGFKYELGKSYEHTGAIELCNLGFHACEYPLDILYYYDAVGPMALVELGDVSEKIDGGDSKRCARKITIKERLTIPMMVQAALKYILKRCNPAKEAHTKANHKATSTAGDRSASSATGDSSASSATGDRSASSATGYRSASSAAGSGSVSNTTGDGSASSATGYRSASSATGYRSASSASGYSSASSATGYISASSVTGDRSASSTTGSRSVSSTTGSRSVSNTTGDSSASSATGDGSASSATGRRSASSASGYSSASLTTGNFSSSEVTQADSQSVAIGVGYANKARAAMGCAIVLAYRNDRDELIHIRASKVGENGLKPDTWYYLNGAGEFKEDGQT